MMLYLDDADIKGTFVGYCNNCANGDIYWITGWERGTWIRSEPCQHGFTYGLDNVFNYVYVSYYKCDSCSYMRTEDTNIRKEETECSGYN